MIPAIKSEFRKLLSIRSTYVLSAIALAIVVFFSFWVQGYKLDASSLADPTQLSGDATSALSAIIVFAAIVAVLNMAHEYRYNTIGYTLTAVNNRTKVLMAKIIVISSYALVFTFLVASLSPLLADLGAHLHGAHFAPQVFDWGNLIWRCLFFGWAYPLLALLIVTIARNQVASTASIFLIPTVEAIIGILLKNNSVYLPFTALQSVMNHPDRGSISPGRAALVFTGYLLIGWTVAWVLFLRRDAS